MRITPKIILLENANVWQWEFQSITQQHPLLQPKQYGVTGAFQKADIWVVGSCVAAITPPLQFNVCINNKHISYHHFTDIPSDGVIPVEKTDLPYKVLNVLERLSIGVSDDESVRTTIPVVVKHYEFNYCLPGLIDAHLHVEFTALSKEGVNLFGVSELNELFAVVGKWINKKYNSTTTNYEEDNPVQQPQSDCLVEAFCLDESSFASTINCHTLDQWNCDFPLIIWSRCWHKIWVNSNTLKLICREIDKTSNENHTDKDIFPSCLYDGIFIENDITTYILPILTRGNRQQRVLRELKHLASLGLTSIQTCDFNISHVYKELHNKNRLPLRVYHHPFYEDLENYITSLVDNIHSSNKAIGCDIVCNNKIVEETEADNLIKCLNKLKSSGSGENANWLYQLHSSFNVYNEQGMRSSGLLCCNRVKIFADGSLGSRSAALRYPYRHTAQNRHPNYGILRESNEQLLSKLKIINQCGLGVEIHTIGDAAVEMALDILETKPQDINPILTHCQLLGDDLVLRMQQCGAIASIQPSFVPSDVNELPNIIDIEKYEPYIYCWRTLLRHGVVCAGGSDSPIELADPLKGIYDAMYRPTQSLPTASHYSEYISYDNNKTHEHGIVDVHYKIQDQAPHNKIECHSPDECLSFSEALSLYTLGAAFTCCHDMYRHRNEKLNECMGAVSIVRGQITENDQADITVINKDISIDSRLTIPLCKVIGTWVAGIEQLIESTP